MVAENRGSASLPATEGIAKIITAGKAAFFRDLADSQLCRTQQLLSLPHAGLLQILLKAEAGEHLKALGKVGASHLHTDQQNLFVYFYNSSNLQKNTRFLLQLPENTQQNGCGYIFFALH